MWEKRVNSPQEIRNLHTGPSARGRWTGCVNGPNVLCCSMKDAPLQLYGLSPDVVHRPDMQEKNTSEGNKSRWGLLFYSRTRHTVLHSVRFHTKMHSTVKNWAELQVCIQLRWMKKMCFCHCKWWILQSRSGVTSYIKVPYGCASTLRRQLGGMSIPHMNTCG